MKGKLRFVWLAQGVHPTIPGDHLSVHATRLGAQKQALKDLNMIRADFDLLPVTLKDFDRGLVELRSKAEDDACSDDDDPDIWVNRYTVKP